MLYANCSSAQVPKPAPTSTPQSTAERAVTLAEKGNCTEGLPLLKKSIHQIANKDLQKRAGLVGLNCAMTHNMPSDALPFLEVLVREFPRDPEVLYAAAHAYSDLSLRTSQELMREAVGSPGTELEFAL